MAKKLKILVIFALFVSLGALATNGVGASVVSMTVADGDMIILPEYDAGNVIVNFTGNYINKSKDDFQGEIGYYVPNDGEIFMVCEMEEGMVCIAYDIDYLEGDFKLVRWTPSRAIAPGEKYPVMVEYTLDLDLQSPQRIISLPFKAKDEMAELRIEVKEPFRATDFTMDPDFPQVGRDNKGFYRYGQTYQALAPGEDLRFQISYQKNDPEPSLDEAVVATGGGPPSPQLGNNNKVIVIFTLALVALMGIVIFSFSRDKPATGKRAGSKRKNKK